MNLEKIKTLSLDNKKSLEQIALKLSEETGEVAQALLSATNASGSGYKTQGYDDVKEECIDVIMVALSLFYKSGGTDEELSETMNLKVDKWQRKTRIDTLNKTIKMLNFNLENVCEKNTFIYLDVEEMLAKSKEELKKTRRGSVTWKTLKNYIVWDSI